MAGDACALSLSPGGVGTFRWIAGRAAHLGVGKAASRACLWRLSIWALTLVKNAGKPPCHCYVISYHTYPQKATTEHGFRQLNFRLFHVIFVWPTHSGENQVVSSFGPA